MTTTTPANLTHTDRIALGADGMRIVCRDLQRQLSEIPANMNNSHAPAGPLGLLAVAGAALVRHIEEHDAPEARRLPLADACRRVAAEAERLAVASFRVGGDYTPESYSREVKNFCATAAHDLDGAVETFLEG